MSISVDGTNGVTYPDLSVQNTAATGFGFKNRIINGACVIDQRNAGASVTNVAGILYSVDRFWTYGAQASKYTAQQNAGSVTPPAGFSKYLGVTSSSAYSVGSTEFFQLYQSIEGFNVADFGWGTSSAQSVTLSFWVRSSLTGTFGGSLLNADSNRSYAYSYTISAANTWEQKTVTIPGDITGTWGAGNGVGIYLGFSLGSGSSASGTANTWSASALRAPTGATSVVGTSGATFYITGVQLEKGSTATSFDYRPYGTELALCQRYYEKSYDQGTAPATNTTTGTFNFSGASEGNGNVIVPIQYSTKRTAPTLTGYLAAGTSGSWNYERSGSSSTGSITFDRTSDRESRAYIVVGSNFVAAYVYGHWIASAEL